MKVLVISAHPDDETLGCGGTLLMHRSRGHSLNWAICTKSLGSNWSDRQREAKAEEVKTVSEKYGMDSVFWGDWPTATLDTIGLSPLIGFLAEVIREVRPEVVYTVHGGDAHSDHRVVFEAAMSTLKPFHMGENGVKRVLGYEVLSSTEAGYQPPYFLPTSYSDISTFIDEKIEMFGIYESETQKGEMPRSASAIKALARYRGATIGVPYAEGFMLLREIL